MNSSNPSTLHHRRSIRLHGYDYSQPGQYFITICSYQHQPVFGEIINYEMQLNEWGQIVHDEWVKTPLMRKEIELGAFILMPDHFHAIVHIIDCGNVQIACANALGAYGHTPLTDLQNPLCTPSKTIGAMIRGFKGSVTTRINMLRHTPGIPIWQRNYYEHIIKTEKEYQQIDAYIKNNPANWQNK